MNDLNDWIAINVMGWFKTKESHPFSYKYFSDKKCLSTQRMEVDWNPAEDIAQAMYVLDQLIEDGWTCDIIMEKNAYSVLCLKADKSAPGASESLTEAICLAAKAAKESEL